MPESPRWLLSKERYEEADEVLCALANADINDPRVQEDRNAIVDTIREEDANGGFSLKSVFFDTSGQKITIRILLAMLVQMLQQLPGVSRSCTSLHEGRADNNTGQHGVLLLFCHLPKLGHRQQDSSHPRWSLLHRFLAWLAHGNSFD